MGKLIFENFVVRFFCRKIFHVSIQLHGDGGGGGRRGQHGGEGAEEGRRGRGTAPGATLNIIEQIWDTFGKIGF